MSFARWFETRIVSTVVPKLPVCAQGAGTLVMVGRSPGQQDAVWGALQLETKGDSCLF